MQDWIAAGYDPHTGEFPGESAPDKSSHDSGIQIYILDRRLLIYMPA